MHQDRWVRGDYVPTKFDKIVSEMESTHGVDAVWNSVRDILLTTNDEYVRRELIESYGNSKVDDEHKMSLLEMILLDDKINKTSKSTAMKELKEPFWDDAWPKFLKRLYRVVDDEVRQTLCYELALIDFHTSGIRDDANKDDNIYLQRLVWYFCEMLTVYPRDRILSKVEDKYVPKYGKKQVVKVLNFILYNEYSTDRTRDYAKYVMGKLNP